MVRQSMRRGGLYPDAAAWKCEASRARAGQNPTFSGTLLLVGLPLSPLPSWPNELRPITQIPPSASRRIAWARPAATARIGGSAGICVGALRSMLSPRPSWPEKFCPQPHAAPSLASACAVVGLYLSYYLDTASGAMIVLAQGVVFAGAYLFGPRHGVLAQRARRRSARRLA